MLARLHCAGHNDDVHMRPDTAPDNIKLSRTNESLEALQSSSSSSSSSSPSNQQREPPALTLSLTLSLSFPHSAASTCRGVDDTSNDFQWQCRRWRDESIVARGMSHSHSDSDSDSTQPELEPVSSSLSAPVSRTPQSFHPLHLCPSTRLLHGGIHWQWRARTDRVLSPCEHNTHGVLWVPRVV